MQRIAVIGLGLNGMLAAIAAKSAGFDVDIIEGSDIRFEQDGRTSLLTPQTLSFLRDLNIYESVKTQSAPIFHIYSFEETAAPVLSFDVPSSIESALGFVIRNSILKRILLEKISELKINIIKKNFEKGKHGANFINIFGVDYKLLISCGGKNDTLLKAEGINKYNLPYNQAAFVFNIKHEKPHNNIAVESFNIGGVLAILPIQSALEEKDCASAVIFTERESASDFLSTLNDEQFLAHFKSACKRMNHLGAILSIEGNIQKYPLSLSIARSAISDRIIFVGDSYNSIHPVAGQAFNISVKDIINIHKALIKAQGLGLDIGSPTFLNGIYKNNIPHHLEMNLFTHLLIKIFSNGSPVLKIFRNFGLRAINEVGFLKRILMKKAGGL